MKKLLFLAIFCLFLFGCENENNTEIEKNQNNQINNNEKPNNNIQSNNINIDEYTQIRDYSNDLITKINNINNDNILVYKKAIFERSVYFVEYETTDETSFTVRFNDNYDFVGITIMNPNIKEYTEDFIQIRTKYLSLAPFYEDCSKHFLCSDIMFGLDNGDYVINNIEISNHSPVTFATRDISI